MPRRMRMGGDGDDDGDGVAGSGGSAGWLDVRMYRRGNVLYQTDKRRRTEAGARFSIRQRFEVDSWVESPFLSNGRCAVGRWRRAGAGGERERGRGRWAGGRADGMEGWARWMRWMARMRESR